MLSGFLLPALTFVTMGLVLFFVLWSKSRTEDDLDDPYTRKSGLARVEADPHFLPSREITDPHRVAG